MLNLKKVMSMVLVLCTMVWAASLIADVKQESTTKMDFKAGLGTMMKLFGAEKPIRTVEYVKGNLHRSDRLDKKGKKVEETTITDLDREMFITINHKKKKYTEMTFAEWKEMLQSGLQGLTIPKGEEGEEPPDEDMPEVKWSFKLDIETPNESEEIAGHKTHKVILKINVEAEATKKAEGDEPAQKAKGGMKVISTNMMAKTVEGAHELRDFQMRLAEKLGFKPGQGGIADILAKVMQSNEQLAEAIKKMQEEGDKLEGVPMRNHTVFETWGESPDEQARKDDENQIPKSIGGLFKKFGKKKDKDKSKSNVLLEIKTEIKRYDTSPLSADIFMVPAKYKLEQYSRK